MSDVIQLRVFNSNKKAIIDLSDYQLLPPNPRLRYNVFQNRIILSFQGKTLSLPRVIYKLHYEIHTKQQVCNKNGDIFDCRFSNLMLIDHASAQWRSNRKAPYGYRGVGFNKASAKYTSQISYRKRDYRLGTFQTAIEAALMYNAAASFLFGEHAQLNPITQHQVNFITNNRDRMISFVQKITRYELKIEPEFFDKSLKPKLVKADKITFEQLKTMLE